MWDNKSVAAGGVKIGFQRKDCALRQTAVEGCSSCLIFSIVKWTYKADKLYLILQYDRSCGFDIINAGNFETKTPIGIDSNL